MRPLIVVLCDRVSLNTMLDASADGVVMITSWVEKFFQDYAEAFRSKSRGRLLAKFCLPLTFLTKSGPIALNDEDSLSANMDALMRRCEKIGAVDWKYTIRDVRAIGAGIHLVEIEWRIFTAYNELLYSCDTSYILGGEVNTDVKVMTIIAHNENEGYEKALNRKEGV
jgi:hypothetical protein